MDLRSSEVEAMVGEQGRAAEPRPKRGQPIILHNVGGVSSSASNFTLTDLWRGQALPKSTDELSVCLAQRVPQLLHSRQYYYFCAFMILINLAMVIWVRLLPSFMSTMSASCFPSHLEGTVCVASLPCPPIAVITLVHALCLVAMPLVYCL